MTDAPKPKRRWFQYSLRTLLVFVLVTSIGMSWFAMKMQKAERQKATVKVILELGGTVVYDDKFQVSGHGGHNVTQPGPSWLCKPLGHDFFANITDVVHNQREAH